MEHEVFEFTPQFSITQPMTFKEIHNLCNIGIDALKKRFLKYGVMVTDTLTGEYSADLCNKVLNDACDIKNWKIAGYYSAREGAEKLGCSCSTFKNKLKKYNIPYIRQYLYAKGIIWVSKTNFNKLAELCKPADKSIPTENYINYKQLAIKYNLSLRQVQRIGKYYHIPYIKGKQGVFLFNAEYGSQLEAKIKAYLTSKKEKENCRKHPLVKDKRFFKLSYFPDSEPVCFEDIEQD